MLLTTTESSKTAARRSTTHPCGGIALSSSLSTLARLTDPGVSSVVIRRRLRGELARLSPPVEPDYCRMVALGSGVRVESLVGNEFPAGAQRALQRDLRRLSDAFCGLFPGSGRAELYVTDRDDCRKFHVDFYRARLLVTYSGPGTDLVPEDAVNRAELCREDFADAESANRAIVTDLRLIVRAAPGDAVLLKGHHFGSGRAAVHRSPPIQADKQVRLIFKMTVT
jgi:hypothetical protein